jgi:hypothetical protein
VLATAAFHTAAAALLLAAVGLEFGFGAGRVRRLERTTKTRLRSFAAASFAAATLLGVGRLRFALLWLLEDGEILFLD